MALPHSTESLFSPAMNYASTYPGVLTSGSHTKNVYWVKWSDKKDRKQNDLVANWERVNFRLHCKETPTRGQEVLKNDRRDLVWKGALKVLALELWPGGNPARTLLPLACRIHRKAMRSVVPGFTAFPCGRCLSAFQHTQIPNTLYAPFLYLLRESYPPGVPFSILLWLLKLPSPYLSDSPFAQRF